MIDLDRQLEESAYWTFTPAGIAIPGFFATIDWTERDRIRFWHAHDDRFAHLALPAMVPIFFAYEAEHRRAPIRTMEAALAALARIAETGYDTVLAMAIKAASEAARNQIYREGLAEAGRRAANKLEHSNKGLPAGAAANLALMRAALKMPVRASGS